MARVVLALCLSKSLVLASQSSGARGPTRLPTELSSKSPLASKDASHDGNVARCKEWCEASLYPWEKKCSWPTLHCASCPKCFGLAAGEPKAKGGAQNKRLAAPRAPAQATESRETEPLGCEPHCLGITLSGKPQPKPPSRLPGTEAPAMPSWLLRRKSSGLAKQHQPAADPPSMHAQPSSRDASSARRSEAARRGATALEEERRAARRAAGGGREAREGGAPSAATARRGQPAAPDANPELRASWQYSLGMEVLNTHAFIHIPKTGGTTVEALAPRELTVRAQTQDCCRYTGPGSLPQWCCGPAPPWHMAPDLLRRYFINRTVYKPDAPRWCIVRDPAERWASGLAWSSRGHEPNTWFGKPRVPPLELLHTFSAGREAVELWTDELLHMQPQHWFVWDALGHVQCDCVVAFEQLPYITSLRLQNSSHVKARFDELPPPLRLLYGLDLQLWQLATESLSPERGFCYRPLSLSEERLLKGKAARRGGNYGRRHALDWSYSHGRAARDGDDPDERGGDFYGRRPELDVLVAEVVEGARLLLGGHAPSFWAAPYSWLALALCLAGIAGYVCLARADDGAGAATPPRPRRSPSMASLTASLLHACSSGRASFNHPLGSSSRSLRSSSRSKDGDAVQPPAWLEEVHGPQPGVYGQRAQCALNRNTSTAALIREDSEGSLMGFSRSSTPPYS